MMEVLILDTCSVPNWADCFQEWHSDGGTIIGLVPSDSPNGNVALQMLHLGASGILTLSENLHEQVLWAIDAVAKGRLWIGREVMDAYLQWMRLTIRNLTVSDTRLTRREKQILNLLWQDLSNRMIAQQLALSERTIKFHVSNILRKLNLTNRRELQSLDRNKCLFSIPQFKILSHVQT
jgi:DNA-binding NarL/FixJ family response regulator